MPRGRGRRSAAGATTAAGAHRRTVTPARAHRDHRSRRRAPVFARCLWRGHPPRSLLARQVSQASPAPRPRAVSTRRRQASPRYSALGVNRRLGQVFDRNPVAGAPRGARYVLGQCDDRRPSPAGAPGDATATSPGTAVLGTQPNTRPATQVAFAASRKSVHQRLESLRLSMLTRARVNSTSI